MKSRYALLLSLLVVRGSVAAEASVEGGVGSTDRRVRNGRASFTSVAAHLREQQLRGGDEEPQRARAQQLQQHHRRTQFCAAIYLPVSCTLQGIDFPSLCDAEVAGYNAEDCTLPPHQGSECPSSASSAHAAVMCDGTTYMHICAASEAGYIPSEDCVAATEDNGDKGQGNVVPSSANQCARRASNPVTCGKKNKEFDNLCHAKAAGFKRRNCRKQKRRRHQAD